MLSDLLADDRGLAPFGADSPTHALMGRFGNVLLVNGRRPPRSTSARNRSSGSHHERVGRAHLQPVLPGARA